MKFARLTLKHFIGPVDIPIPEGGTFIGTIVMMRAEGGAILPDKYVAFNDIACAFELETTSVGVSGPVDYTKKPN